MNLSGVLGFLVVATILGSGRGTRTERSLPVHPRLDKNQPIHCIELPFTSLNKVRVWISDSYSTTMLAVLFAIAFLTRTYRRLFTRAALFPPLEHDSEKKLLYDFTTVDDVNGWLEVSDTVRTVGMSKAVLTLQTTQVFQRAVFFTLLNPQPNGAGFAGVRARTNLNLTNFERIEITCRGQGGNSHYKVVLRHRGLDSNEDVTYEQFFTAPMSDSEFSTVVLPLADFKPYYRGREVPDADPLDKANITSIGLQIYGGVYMPIKQKGVSALEIQCIAAS